MIGMKIINNLVIRLRASSLKIVTIKNMSLLSGMIIRSLELNRMTHRELSRSINSVQSSLLFITPRNKDYIN